jgi:hypothetical protein
MLNELSETDWEFDEFDVFRGWVEDHLAYYKEIYEDLG